MISFDNFSWLGRNIETKCFAWIPFFRNGFSFIKKKIKTKTFFIRDLKWTFQGIFCRFSKTSMPRTWLQQVFLVMCYTLPTFVTSEIILLPWEFSSEHCPQFADLIGVTSGDFQDKIMPFALRFTLEKPIMNPYTTYTSQRFEFNLEIGF